MMLASFLHRELPVRIAHSIDDLEHCDSLFVTYVLSSLAHKPSHNNTYYYRKPIQKVCDLYEKSFRMLRKVSEPSNVATEREFESVVQRIYDKQSPILSLVAQGTSS
jgi:hypothetical protein